MRRWTVFFMLVAPAFFNSHCSSSKVEVSRRQTQTTDATSSGTPLEQISPSDPVVESSPSENSSPKMPAVDDGPIQIPATVTATIRKGMAEDDKKTPAGPGLILMGGGTDVDSAFVWAHRVIAGDATSRRGDVLVLRASGADGYDDYIAGLAPFQSVQTLIISNAVTKDHLNTIARLVDRSEFVFFAGGNQADYVAWRDSNLMKSVQGVYTRGGVVGGTSAGLAILGQSVFDAVSAGAQNVVTPDAVADPFMASISFTRDMLSFPTMKSVLTDSHFRERDRFGRLTAFVARQFADAAVPNTAKFTGLGVDEATAVLVDGRGKGTLATGSLGAAFLIRGSAPTRAIRNQSLMYSNLDILRLDATTQYYDFVQSCGTGIRYQVTIDGSQNPISNPSDVYVVAGTPGTCP